MARKCRHECKLGNTLGCDTDLYQGMLIIDHDAYNKDPFFQNHEG